MDGRIFQVRKQIIGNLQHQWTIRELAKIANLSEPHLWRLFKAEIKTSPIACVRELRLEKARELLETTFTHINIIGYEVGIPSGSHFARDFKKKYGMTPTEYRTQYWEKIQAEEADDRKG